MSVYDCMGYGMRYFMIDTCYVVFFTRHSYFCFYSLSSLAIAIWMAVLWITEIIPMVITGLLPIVLFPYFGILDSAVVTSKYANNTIFLFISGVFMAMALERWDLHRRFSLKILSWFGCKPQSLLLAFMFSTFLLSMVVSNNATALMMVPNATQVMQGIKDCSNSSTQDDGNANAEADVENDVGEDDKAHVANNVSKGSIEKLQKAVLLGVAYGANTGGLASLVGSAANLLVAEQLATIFPDAPTLTFVNWLGFGFPIAIIIFFFIWAYLSLKYLRNVPPVEGLKNDTFKTKYSEMGKWTREQNIVGVLFFIEIVLWISRRGWSKVFPVPDYISDTTVGMTFGVILFLIPARVSCFCVKPRAFSVGKSLLFVPTTSFFLFQVMQSIQGCNCR